MKFNKNTVGIILLSSLIIQLIIIVYNHLTGYIDIRSIDDFTIRILYGTVLTFIFGLLLVYSDIIILNRLEIISPWAHKSLFRIMIETAGGILTGAILGSLITLLSNTLSPYNDGLVKNLINNSLITVIINIIVIAALEAVSHFKRNKEASLKAERLEKENMKIQMETLKNQLNPHFLFNSLNVLSALVSRDTEKAQYFIEEFSSVYRYVLDVFDKAVVELKDEITFAKSFLYLQKIRFEDSVSVEINIQASMLSMYIPPLAVQTILENAFKHNKASKEHPLKIKIFNNGDFLYIINNLQVKQSGRSSGVGLVNLKKRYNLLSNSIPDFRISGDEYIAVLPLINAE